MKTTNQFYILTQLIAKDLTIFYRGLKDKLIDLVIMLTLNVLIFGYFMPGVADNFGTFILVGAIASFGFFEVVGKVGMLIADIDGDRTINYKLILPINTNWVFCAQALSWALESALVNIILFPIGKLLLYSRFDMSKISVLKLIPIIFAANLFFGFFALWTTSMLKGGVNSLSHLWIRFISPIYFFGCYFYPWKAAFALSPIIGYLTLLNPFAHVMEGSRNAVLGAEGFLPFYLTLPALLIFVLLFGAHAIKRLKVKLDCI
ncbi:MAG TPA: hypothetical protein VFF04_02310 [Candidatus Babeliales bacterium]|nr:hypothetical protein [Candidatus Babeliales bacterium]